MNTEKLSIPLAIIIAGGLIAGALYYSNVKASKLSQNAQLTPPANADIGDMKPITSSDHILGNPNADVVIVEYSDLECPYCKLFHPTLKRLMDEYGKDGKVAWVYRHFPIPQLHPKAPKEAEASECANELGGQTKFWEFINSVYSVTQSNNSLDDGVYNIPKNPPLDENGKPFYTQNKPRSSDDAGQLSDIAKSIGLDVKAFNTCLASGKYTSKVQADYDDAIKSGGKGTPNSIVVYKDGTKTLIQGAQPYENVKSIVDALIK